MSWRLPRVPLVVAAGAAMLVIATSTLGAEKNIPAWHKAGPGTRAFLDDDGGGVETATVCDSADRYRDWIDEKHPPGCQTFQHNLPVVIEIVTFDSAKDITSNGRENIGLPIAKIHIPSRSFVGYVHLMQLKPVIPPGTIIHFGQIENDSFELYPRAVISKYKEQGMKLGGHVTARVIGYDPSNKDKWDLDVSILDGEHAGQSGWMLLTFSAKAEDGNLLGQFSNAVLSIPSQTNDSTPNPQRMENPTNHVVRCDSVGIAKFIVTDMFNNNPSAKSFGLAAQEVVLDGVLPDGSCLVEVHTNHGYAMKYKFRYDEAGKATLDLLP